MRKLRLGYAGISGTPPLPAALRVRRRLRKTTHAMAIAGVTATEEVPQTRGGALQRRERLHSRRIVGNVGPLGVGDARLRLASDNAERRARRRADEIRLQKKARNQEAASSRKRLATTRAFIKAARGVPGDSTTPRPLLRDGDVLRQHYCPQREMRERPRNGHHSGASAAWA
ncbi:hypothetical protein F5Y19DRAFT_320907 [Xylariaceae sp. FL1651]|nr:hypothetical protein F5Y19DRAFT_320907 [Xylariaceae sp. FL1651]